MTITQAGEPLRKLGSRKSLAMVAYLANRREAVSRTRLADLLWADKTEAAGRTNVRWVLNNLSQLFPNCFVSQRETIQFQPASDIQVDTLIFDTLRSVGDFDSLALALDQYRGEFMEGFFLNDSPDFEQWMLQERTARQQQVTHIIDALIAHHSHYNQHYHAQRLITRLLEIEPWREDAHRQKMRYLARQGQRSSALKQYEICCQILESELQVQPEPETIALYERIRKGEDPGEVHEPVSLAHPADSAPAKPVMFRQHLPLQITPFIGRITEVEHLSQLITGESRLLTLTGQGGIGKTRLAIEIATRVATFFNNRVYFVSLAPVTDEGDVPHAIAASAGYQFRHDIDTTRQLLDFFAETHVLLVMDNFEHLETGGKLLSHLLSHAPNLRILVSSRSRMNLMAEYVYEVQELGLPEETTTGEISDAVALFMIHLHRILPGYRLTAEDHSIIAKICNLAQGVPLALVLAASWLSSLTLVEIATELSHNIDLLTQDHPDVPERQRSLRATFEYTWQMLSPSEQVALAKMTVFKGDYSRDAVVHVTETNLHTLSSLINKSLVRHNPQNGRYTMHELQRQFAAEKLAANDSVSSLYERHARYYARWLHQYREALYGPNMPDVRDIITADINNIRQAWNYALKNRDWTAIDEALHSLGRYYQVTGLFQDAEIVFSVAIENLASEPDTRPDTRLLLARLHHEYAALFSGPGKSTRAIESARQIIQIGQQYHQASLEAAGYLDQAKAWWHEGNVRSTQQSLDRSLALSDDSSSLFVYSVRSEALRIMGMAKVRAGDYQGARDYYEQGLHHSRSRGDIYSEGQILGNLGAVYRNIGDYESARKYYLQALQIHRKMNNYHGECVVLNGLGDVVFYLNDYSGALQHYEACLKLAQTTGDRRAEGIVLNNIGIVLRSLGDYENARSRFEQSIHIKETIAFEREKAWSLSCLGLLHHQCGDHATALNLCEAAWHIFHRLGDHSGEGFSLLYLGHVLTALNRADEASALYEYVISIQQTINRSHILIEAEAGLAQALIQKNEIRRAVEIVESILDYMDQHTLNGTYEPFRVYHTCYIVLRAAGDLRACSLLDTAQSILQAHISTIDDPALQVSFQSRVALNHALINLICS